MDDRAAEVLRILMLEDTPSDAELEESELRDAGLVFTLLRVDTRAAFEQALEEFKPGIVIADYRLPGYNGREALEYARRTHPQIPVIMVTGAMGDEAAVELLKLGARDYVLKGSLARLAPAVRRALSEEQGIRKRKLAEAAVRESEIRYRRLFEAAKDGILILDAESGVIVDANPFILELLSYSRDECVGKMMWEIGLFADAELSKVAFEESQSHGHIRYEDLPLQTKDGRRRHVEFISNVYEVEGHRVIQCSIRDITERLLMDKALRESEARYKRITEAITDYQYTVRIENGYVVETRQSPACVTVTGYTAEEFAANPNLWIQMVVPEDRERVIKRVRHVLAGEDVPPMEHRIIHKNGSLRWVHCTIILFKDAAGNLLSYDGVIRDVTERVAAAQAVSESEEKFRSITASAQDAILMLDNEGNISYWNAAAEKIFGYLAQEAMGQPLHELLAPERFLDAYHKGISHFWETGEGPVVGKTVELVGLRKGSTEFPLELSLSAIKRGGLWNAIGIIRDITERKQAEQLIYEEKLFSESLIHSLPDIFFLLDQQGALLQWNDRFAELFGLSNEEILGKNALAFVLEEDRPYVAQQLQLAFETGAASVEARALVQSGMRHYLLMGNRIETKLGVNLIGIGLDITERKAAEAGLRLFRALVDHSSDAIWVNDPETYRLVDVNETACRMLGYSREELLSMFIQDIDPGIGDLGMKRVAKNLQENGSAVIESRHRRKDGSTFPVEVSIKIVGIDRDYGVSMVRDITERKLAEAALLRLNRTLRALSAGNHALVHSNDEKSLLENMCRATAEGGYVLAWVGYALQNEQKSIVPMAVFGEGKEYVDALNLTWDDQPLGRGISGSAVRSGQTQIVDEIQSDSRMVPWREAAASYGLASSIALPLKVNGEVMGVLTIYSDEPGAFGTDQVALLEEMASDLAYGIVTLRIRTEHEQHATILRQSLEQSIQTIAGTVEARDPYTAGHQRRVAELARAIAQEMGLPEEQVNGIHLAAIVHDLGKIHIPAEILSKPGRLNDVEYMLIKMHPQAGYDILKNVKFPWPIADIVLQHHERLDGSGYPQGLKGGEILLESRIMTVADVVEAMSSHRPYRPGLGIEAALEEIVRMRGKYYDPKVVDACVALFRERNYVIPG